MNTMIKLRVKKENERGTEAKILKLKGSLITRGYTEIIHIADENDDFYLNTFATSKDQKKEVAEYLLEYISLHELHNTITLLDK